MNGTVARAANLATPRVLLALVLLLGVLGAQTGGGTLAYFTSTQTVSNNVFTAGTLDITASALASGTGSSLTFTTDGQVTSGTDCALYGLTTAAMITTQRLTPGVFCTGKLTVNNAASNIDAYLRLRLVRTGTLGNVPAADTSLTDKLKFYLNEVASGDSCTTSTFTPGTLTLGTPVALATADDINGKVIGSGGLSIAATAAGTTEANMTAAPTAWANLIGNSTVDGNLASGATSATLTAATSRYFCAAIYLPSVSVVGEGNTTGDNTVQGGGNTFAINMTAAQMSGRP